MSDKDNLLRLAAACRNCQEPTCQLACPAGIEIPKFIDLFLDGKEHEAYEVIRQANVFPEVCAWLCPVEQQCQGHCLQHFIGDGPLPIADIQRYLSEQANKHAVEAANPQKASGRKVAIIGAGRAGVRARLLEAGHSVTIFDRSALSAEWSSRSSRRSPEPGAGQRAEGDFFGCARRPHDAASRARA